MSSTHDQLGTVADAAEVAYAVWRRTDFDGINAARNLDDEFASRIATAGYTDSVASFVDRLTAKWGVRSLQDEAVLQVVQKYDGDDSDVTARDFLRTVRDNSALVVLEMKHRHADSDE